MGTQPIPKGAQPQFSSHVCWPNSGMDQFQLVRMYRPRSRLQFVLDGDIAPLKRGTAPQLFGPCLLWPNGWMDHDAMHLVRSIGPGHMLDGDPASSPEWGTAAPSLFSPCLLWPNGRPSQLLLSSYVTTQPVVYIQSPVPSTSYSLEIGQCLGLI